MGADTVSPFPIATATRQNEVDCGRAASECYPARCLTQTRLRASEVPASRDRCQIRRRQTHCGVCHRAEYRSASHRCRYLRLRECALQSAIEDDGSRTRPRLCRPRSGAIPTHGSRRRFRSRSSGLTSPGRPSAESITRTATVTCSAPARRWMALGDISRL